MQSLGPAARPGLKFRTNRAFRRTRTKSVGLMLGSGEAITTYYALAAGLCVVLESCYLGSVLDPPALVWFPSGLWLGFWKNVASLTSVTAIHSAVTDTYITYITNHVSRRPSCSMVSSHLFLHELCCQGSRIDFIILSMLFEGLTTTIIGSTRIGWA